MGGKNLVAERADPNTPFWLVLDAFMNTGLGKLGDVSLEDGGSGFLRGEMKVKEGAAVADGFPSLLKNLSRIS